MVGYRTEGNSIRNWSHTRRHGDDVVRIYGGHIIIASPHHYLDSITPPHHHRTNTKFHINPKNITKMKDNPFLVSARGKLGNMVTFVRNGEQITRAYQPVVFNPMTVRQQLSRAKLALASAYSRGFAKVIKIGYGFFVGKGRTARNMFVSEIIPVDKEVIDGNTPLNVTLDPEKLPLSKGNIPNVGWGAADYSAPQQVEVQIADTVALEPLMGDETKAYGIYLVVAMEEAMIEENRIKLCAVVNTVEDLNAIQSVTINVPNSWQGKRVHVYGFVKEIPVAINGIATNVVPTRYPGEASNSIHIGSGTIA